MGYFFFQCWKFAQANDNSVDFVAFVYKYLFSLNSFLAQYSISVHISGYLGQLLPAWSSNFFLSVKQTQNEFLLFFFLWICSITSSHTKSLCPSVFEEILILQLKIIFVSIKCHNITVCKDTFKMLLSSFFPHSY